MIDIPTFLPAIHASFFLNGESRLSTTSCLMGLNRGDYYDRTRLALVLIHGCEQVADHCIELEVVMFMRRSYAQAGLPLGLPRHTKSLTTLTSLAVVQALIG